MSYDDNYESKDYANARRAPDYLTTGDAHPIIKDVARKARAKFVFERRFNPLMYLPIIDRFAAWEIMDDHVGEAVTPEDRRLIMRHVRRGPPRAQP